MASDVETRRFPFVDAAGLNALSLLGSAIYIYSFETQSVCWANPKGLMVWNARSEEELYARSLTPFSQATNLRLEDYRQAFARGEDRLDTWTLYPLGEARPVLCRCSGVSIKGHGQAMLVECSLESAVGITAAEVRSIEALRHTPLKISLLSRSGEVLMRNPAATALFAEFDHSLPPGADHFSSMFANPADCDALVAAAESGKVGRLQAPLRLPGSPIHALNLSVATDPISGKPAWLVAHDDISLLVQTLRQLAASEDALDAILNLDLTPTVILAASDGKVLNVNVSARKALDQALAIGSPANSLFVDHGDFERLRSSVLSGQASAAPVQFRGANGEPFWASLSAARISYDKQDSIAILLADVDAMYRIAADLEAALSMERAITDAQRRFLAIASHEFRTPLAVIDSAAQRIERLIGKADEENIRSRVGNIRRAVAGLLQLMDNTLEQAREDKRVLGYAPRVTDLSGLIADVVDSFRESHPDLRIDVDLPPLPLLELDPGLIEQVISNLLSNSAKYAAQQKRALIKVSVTTDEVQLLIRDWGIGVPAEERESIFSEYGRASNVGERPGTGLGLAIVKQVIALHGGTIDAVDIDGPGLAIRIALPRSLSESPAPVAART
ncbi:PAS domain-containing sensor histidine kinase [Sphingomonas lacunae]|uniref:histidine kinase n=1 Tax=Sphingomonas lacunae TaxID=2698828 RepID=A0A6M4AWY8_9SPHN|nr:PAS domain-containing sensor histidine kinase [Sphingomonas lacunae]QJQ32579.1 PAS domain-containing sensor histidine kinase [Sphingomonas lacunae]